MNGRKAKRLRKEERDWTAERDARCTPVVMEIFKCIAAMPKAPINTDEMSKQECYDIYFELNKQISEIISRNGIDVTTDMKHIWQCVREITTITESVVSKSIETNGTLLQDIMFDVKYGEPSLYRADVLAQYLERKETIRKAMKDILAGPVDAPEEIKENK